jgi:hypothetical protein
VPTFLYSLHQNVQLQPIEKLHLLEFASVPLSSY